MNTISAQETLIEGKWISVGEKVEVDDSCKRIDWLVSNILNHVGTDGDNWEAYYQDPNDNRYWIMFYAQSELHGGGPPSLRVATESEKNLKFSAK
jgi:hypothetical protein